MTDGAFNLLKVSNGKVDCMLNNSYVNLWDGFCKSKIHEFTTRRTSMYKLVYSP